MLKILIVEDDPMVSSINQQYLLKSLTNQPLKIYQVATATEALKITPKINPSLILLDVYLPKISGIELLKQFIEKQLHPNVIMLSAANDSQSINQALKYGVLDYLVKPFSFARFQTAITHFLSYQHVLEQKTKLSQTELDQAFMIQPAHNQTDYTQLPKGLSEASLAKIKLALTHCPTKFSNQDVARQVKLSRITTKKYLDYLEQTKEITSQIHYLKIGRPLKLYQLAK